MTLPSLTWTRTDPCVFRMGLFFVVTNGSCASATNETPEKYKRGDTNERRRFEL